MKRIIAIITALIAFPLLALPARADVIYDPLPPEPDPFSSIFFIFGSLLCCVLFLGIIGLVVFLVLRKKPQVGSFVTSQPTEVKSTKTKSKKTK